jgi:hypothetical protein
MENKPKDGGDVGFSPLKDFSCQYKSLILKCSQEFNHERDGKQSLDLNEKKENTIT